MWQHIVAFANYLHVIPTFKEKTMLKQIDREDLCRKLAGNARPVLVEALPEKYWRDWRLPGARTCRTTRWTGRAKGAADRTAEIVGLLREPQLQNSHNRGAPPGAARLRERRRISGRQAGLDGSRFPVDRGEVLAA